MNPDPIAYQELLAPVLATAYRTALHFAASARWAENVVERAALTAYQRIQDCPSESDFRIWFLGITAEVLAAGRRFDALPPQASGSQAEWSDREVRNLTARLSIAQISQAVSQVPEPCQLAVALDLAGPVKPAELASILGCPVDLAREVLREGRRFLQAALRRIATRESSAAAAMLGPEGELRLAI